MNYYFDSNGYLVVNHDTTIDAKATLYNADIHQLPQAFPRKSYDFQTLHTLHDYAVSSGNPAFSAEYLACEAHIIAAIKQQVDKENACKPDRNRCAITTATMKTN